MDIGFAVDHVWIVDDEQIVDALLGSELLEIERGLPVAVEFTRVDDDDFTVMAGEKRDERIAIGLLQVPPSASDSMMQTGVSPPMKQRYLFETLASIFV